MLEFVSHSRARCLACSGTLNTGRVAPVGSVSHRQNVTGTPSRALTQLARRCSSSLLYPSAVIPIPVRECGEIIGTPILFVNRDADILLQYKAGSDPGRVRALRLTGS